jgi:protein-disulfide isomerase
VRKDNLPVDRSRLPLQNLGVFRHSFVSNFSIVLFGLLCGASSPMAQDRVTSSAEKPVLSLQAQIDELRDGQQRLEKEIQEIKSLLQDKAARADYRTKPATPSVISLNVEGEPFRGDAKARVVIMEYSDFNCSFCARYVHEIYPLIDEAYIKTGRIKYFFRDLPAPRDTNAFLKAQAARCAGDQGKFWEMHDWLFGNQAIRETHELASKAAALGFDSSRLDDCLASEKYAENIRRSMDSAERIGLHGTPAFLIGTASEDGQFFWATKTFHGADSFEAFKPMLDELLAGPANSK